MPPKHTTAANQAVGQSLQPTDVPASSTTTSLAAPPPAYGTLNDPNARTNPDAPSAIPLRDMPPSQPWGASGYNSSGIARFGVSNVSGFGHDIGPAGGQYYGTHFSLTMLPLLAERRVCSDFCNAAQVIRCA